MIKHNKFLFNRYQQSKDTERYPIVEASAPEQSLLARHNWRKTNSVSRVAVRIFFFTVLIFLVIRDER